MTQQNSLLGISQAFSSDLELPRWSTVGNGYSDEWIEIRKLLLQVVAAGSVTVAYPFDTVRRRLMMMSGEKEKMYKVKYRKSYLEFKFHGWKDKKSRKYLCSGHNGLLGQDLEGWGSTCLLQGLSLNWEEKHSQRSPFLYRATSQTCSAQLVALWCLSDTMSVSLSSRHTSSPSMPASQATSRQNMIMLSNQDHVTKPPTCNTFLKTSVTSTLFLIRSYLLFAGSKHPVLTDPGILLGICQEILPDPRFCVYTKLWEFNPKWNKLCYLNWNWIGWPNRGGWFW